LRNSGAGTASGIRLAQAADMKMTMRRSTIVLILGLGVAACSPD